MLRRLAIWGALLALSTVGTIAGGEYNYNEYNHRLARISYIQNKLAFAHGDGEWTGASINTPLQPDDRLYTADQSRAEIQFDDGSALRLDSNTEVSMARLDNDHIQMQLGTGLVTLQARSPLYFEVNTPAAAVTAHEKGTYRILVAENGGVDIQVRRGEAIVYNRALEKRLHSGERLAIYSPDSADVQMSRLGRPDEWDNWNERRDAALASRVSSQYLPNDVYVGTYDLDTYGRWVSVPDYGNCWVPTVAVGWSPYRTGRWIYRPFWGWTWVSYEPWGWLPYHYGRWFHRAPYGWAWYPGPRHGFYFWSPGLVRFSYGSDWVSWCPLGPRDIVSGHLFFGRPYYRDYFPRLGFNFGRGPRYGYDNLYNYRAPNAIVSVNHNTFIHNTYINNTYVNQRRPPGDVFRRGTIIEDHRLPIKPTAASFSPNPTAAFRPSRPEIHRQPVFIRTPNSGRGPEITEGNHGFTRTPNSGRGPQMTEGTQGFTRTPNSGRGPQISEGARGFVRTPNSGEGPQINEGARGFTRTPNSGRGPQIMEGASPGIGANRPGVQRPFVNAPAGKSPEIIPENRGPQPSAPSNSPDLRNRAHRPDPSHWPTAPTRRMDESSPRLPPSRSAPPNNVQPSPERPGVRPGPTYRDGAPSVIKAPPSSQEFIQAPPRNRSSSTAPSGTPAPSRPFMEGPAGRQNTPPARVAEPTGRRVPDSGNRQEFMTAPRSEPSHRAPASHNPPPARTAPSFNYNRAPVYNSPPPARTAPSYSPPAQDSTPPARMAPSYDRGGSGRSGHASPPGYSAPPARSAPPPAQHSSPPTHYSAPPSYSSGRTTNSAPAGGSHGESGGRSHERGRYK